MAFGEAFDGREFIEDGGNQIGDVVCFLGGFLHPVFREEGFFGFCEQGIEVGFADFRHEQIIDVHVGGFAIIGTGELGIRGIGGEDDVRPKRREAVVEVGGSGKSQRGLLQNGGGHRIALGFVMGQNESIAGIDV